MFERSLKDDSLGIEVELKNNECFLLRLSDRDLFGCASVTLGQ